MNACDAPRLRRIVLAAVFGLVVLLSVQEGLFAQISSVRRDVRAARGLVVSPVYEGWYEVDGTRYALFGYYNQNTEQVVDVPIGPDNRIAPGDPDQGQPTRFLPGVFYGLFAVRLPKDEKAEVTWTLTANGQTFSIPVLLDPLYLISPQKEGGSGYPGNTPPILKFDPPGPSAQGPHGIVVARTATVGQPLTLDVWVTDDNLPPRRPGTEVPLSALSQHLGAWGLAFIWQVYRGPAAVQFGDATPAVEQGKAQTTATFSKPGEYMLHALAIDSRTPTRCCWTNGYVKVSVRDGGAPR